MTDGTHHIVQNPMQLFGPWPPAPGENVISRLTMYDIQREAREAHETHGAHGTSMASPDLHPGHMLAILMEEVGEVAKEINEAEIAGRPIDAAAMAKELKQVAAMAGTWMEQLRRANGF
jgi:NTP pyrophosphatase (non-canonical NTP hydrolase)